MGRAVFALAITLLLVQGEVVLAQDPESVFARKTVKSVLCQLQDRFGRPVAMPRIVLEPRAAQSNAKRRAAVFLEGGGYYDPDRVEIHVVLMEPNNPDFKRILRHEAAHHYVRQVFGQVPCRLDEGIASDMETTPTSGKTAPWPVNYQRLAEFRSLLKRGRVPDVAQVFSRKGCRSLTSADYAVSWAFVFFMCHNNGPKGPAMQKKILEELLDAADNPKADLYRLFLAMLTSKGIDVEAWQKDWRKTIWHLSDKP